MLIDWFTVGAQALNFIVLVWLLKRYLYKPILNAVDAREKLIAGRLADASAKEAEAQKERETFQRKNDAFDQQRAALMSKATAEAGAERQRLLDDARKAAEALRAKHAAALRSDAQDLNDAIRRRTQEEVFAIARKTLTDLAGASLEERTADVFAGRLGAMDGKVKAGFAQALKAAGEPALVRSAFDLPAAQRGVIQKALDGTFAAKIQVRFETAPDLVSGIELTAGGQKIAWSIADYLASMEKGVSELLKAQEKTQPDAAPKPKPKPKPQVKPKPRPKTKLKPEAKTEPAKGQ
jgi:F-type H+-transporting ATPase subunit b